MLITVLPFCVPYFTIYTVYTKWLLRFNRLLNLNSKMIHCTQIIQNVLKTSPFFVLHIRIAVWHIESAVNSSNHFHFEILIEIVEKPLEKILKFSSNSCGFEFEFSFNGFLMDFKLKQIFPFKLSSHTFPDWFSSKFRLNINTNYYNFNFSSTAPKTTPPIGWWNVRIWWIN